jgi:hypothetical protein
MKQCDIIDDMFRLKKRGSVGVAAVTAFIAIVFLFSMNISTVYAIDNCTNAQMAKCTGCAVGSICCTKTGGCSPVNANNCNFMESCGALSPCTADACRVVKTVPHCTKDQMKMCGQCATGSICCADTGKCADASASTCTGLTCGDSSGTCNANACTTVKKLPDCTQSQMATGCNGCGTGVVCCGSTGGCGTATQADCQFMSCSDDPFGTCNSTACSTVDLQCPGWSHTLTFKNNSSATIWLAAIPGCGKTKCSPDIAEPAGGWAVAAGVTATVTVPACWSGGFIFREGCGWKKDGGTYTCGGKSPCCDVGDCTDKSGKSAYSCNLGGQPPVTRIEMTFDGGYDVDGKKINSLIDYYDISYVDGWSKMVTMEPALPKIWPDTPPDGKDATYWCSVSGCSAAAVTCPDKLVKCKVDGQTKTALACWSPGKYAALHKNDKDQSGNLLFPPALRANLGCVCDADSNVLCNIGSASAPVINPACNSSSNTTFGCSPYSEPGQSNINSQCCPWASTDTRSEACGWDSAHSARVWPQWAKDYVTNIKTACPNAYAWQYDDMSSTYRCRATGADQGVNYLINIYDVSLSSTSCK